MNCGVNDWNDGLWSGPSPLMSKGVTSLTSPLMSKGCFAQPRHSDESRNPEVRRARIQSELASLNPLVFPLGRQGGGLCKAPKGEYKGV